MNPHDRHVDPVKVKGVFPAVTPPPVVRTLKAVVGLEMSSFVPAEQFQKQSPLCFTVRFRTGRRYKH